MKIAALHADPAIFVFDGTCVLCSRGAAFVMRHDPVGKVRFLSAQSELGQAVYRHLGMALDDSYVLIAPDGTYAKTGGWLRVAELLGGFYRVALAFRWVPAALRDRAYDVLARNRYRWFGRTGQCALLSPEQRARLVTADAGLARQLGLGDGGGRG